MHQWSFEVWAWGKVMNVRREREMGWRLCVNKLLVVTSRMEQELPLLDDRDLECESCEWCSVQKQVAERKNDTVQLRERARAISEGERNEEETGSVDALMMWSIESLSFMYFLMSVTASEMCSTGSASFSISIIIWSRARTQRWV